jgi:type IV fimbrial biogenesis protein FimT
MSVAVMTMHNNEWEKGQNPLFFVRPKIPFVGLFNPSVRPYVGQNGPFIRPTAFFHRLSHSSGFTLTELIIALAIAAILLTLAAPNMNVFIRNNRITTETNTLIAHINLARSEATKRNVVVALCRKDPDPSKQASPVCGGGVANDWTSGWLVYVTTSTTADANFNSGTDILLKNESAITNGVAVTSNAAGNLRLAYLPSGQLTAAGTLRFSLCDDRNEANGKNIEILTSGRPSLAKTGIVGSATACTPG